MYKKNICNKNMLGKTYNAPGKCLYLFTVLNSIYIDHYNDWICIMKKTIWKCIILKPNQNLFKGLFQNKEGTGIKNLLKSQHLYLVRLH